MRTPAWCRRQAAAIGPACTQVIDELMAEGALYRLRAAQGVIGLAEKHDGARLEAACARAIEAGDPSYKTIRGILAAGTETQPATVPAAGSRRVPARPGPDLRQRAPLPRHGCRRRRGPGHHRPGRPRQPRRDGAFMTAITDTNGLARALRTLKLSGMLATLKARLAQARAGDLGHLEFLQVLTAVSPASSCGVRRR